MHSVHVHVHNNKKIQLSENQKTTSVGARSQYGMQAPARSHSIYIADCLDVWYSALGGTQFYVPVCTRRRQVRVLTRRLRVLTEACGITWAFYDTASKPWLMWLCHTISTRNTMHPPRCVIIALGWSGSACPLAVMMLTSTDAANAKIKSRCGLQTAQGTKLSGNYFYKTQ
jgi:hypothetical protein